MTKQLQITVFAAVALFCSMSFGQSFTLVTPSALNQGLAAGPVNDIFDISNVFGLPENEFRLQVSNGFVNSTNDTWTVADGRSTRFTLLGSATADAFVNHGANLGANQSGSMPRDGIIAEPGEAWELRSTLDSDYTDGRIGDTYFVDYTGDNTQTELESNGQGFRFFSLQPVSSFEVFSNNTTELNNNYNVSFRLVNAIPEPSSALVVAIAGLGFLRRKRA